MSALLARRGRVGDVRGVHVGGVPGERASSQATIPAVESLIPLPEIAGLVECAVGAVAVLPLANLGAIIAGADSIVSPVTIVGRVVARVGATFDEHSPGPAEVAAVGDVAGHRVTAGRVVEVVAGVTVVLVIRGLVPFVLGGDDPDLAVGGNQGVHFWGVVRRDPVIARRDHTAPANNGTRIVCALVDVFRSQPVSEHRRVVPGDEIH